MPSHYKSYVANFNRVRMSEMIDFHFEQLRVRSMKPSLVVHPLTGRSYDPHPLACDHRRSPDIVT
jgi:hypothetical protein